MHICQIMKLSKSDKMANHKMMKIRNADHFLPLRIGGSFFGLKTGSRGTPWNSKNAGPGGSDFTKCRFWPFKWHFGVLGGVSIFDTFLINFSWFNFCHFFTFYIFWFCQFWCFSFFLIFVTFWVLLILSLFTLFYDFDLFFNFWKGILKIRPSFDPFS